MLGLVSLCHQTYSMPMLFCADSEQQEYNLRREACVLCMMSFQCRHFQTCFTHELEQAGGRGGGGGMMGVGGGGGSGGPSLSF